MTCGACRFWVPDDHFEGRGECRRHAPRPARELSFCWPITAEDGWCGEFQPRRPRGWPVSLPLETKNGR